MGGSVERLLPSPVLCLCDRPALHSNAQKKAAVKAMQEEERCRSCDRPRQVQFGIAEILHFDVDGIECKTKGDHFLQNDMQDDIADHLPKVDINEVVKHVAKLEIQTGEK